MIGESGGLMSWYEDYFKNVPYSLPTDLENMSEAKKLYIDHVSELVKLDNDMGINNVLSVEATACGRYNLEAGIKYLFLEMMCGDPEKMTASVRGTSRAYGRDIWGCHIAHEWYGGLRHDDVLKYSRLRLAYKYAYISGANFIYPESGDFGMVSYGYKYPKDHEFCREYRLAWDEFAEFLKNDHRPENGPLVKVAFVQGNLDSYDGWGAATAWNQFGRTEWGYSDAEKSWEILKNVTKKDKWHIVENYGEHDVSNAPAYGQYDLIPSEAPAEAMKRYDVLIFAGWNTMTEEIFDKLSEYVRCGGVLFITAAHLSVSDKRNGGFTPISEEKISGLLGFEFTSHTFRRNSGYKFFKESFIPEMRYPASGDTFSDPILPSGYAEFAGTKVNSGVVRAVACDSFWERMTSPAVLIENRFGKGTALTLTSVSYPGAQGVFPLYSRIVKELCNSTHRRADIKVIGGDDLTFAVYPDGNKRAVYIINTSFETGCEAKIIWSGENQTKIFLQPLEMKRLDFTL
ncbi:hypothetical protein SDC9_85842 [bioreactor metagenome]|uniref:Beta-galactosidase trimerisation domain-containing protein n=1 Tax=bioreactor metagenome TaxID=1076179 RepID=A0A644ZEL4_9ZZZZ